MTTSNNANEVFAAAAEEQSKAIDAEALETIQQMAENQNELVRAVARKEQELKQAKQDLELFQKKHFPEYLEQFGISSLRLKNGQEIRVEPFYGAHIAKAREAQAFDWLMSHNHNGMIKYDVTAKLEAGQDELVTRLLERMKELGVTARAAQKVHPMTLKAWVREMIETGQDFPRDLFGAHQGQQTVLKG